MLTNISTPSFDPLTARKPTLIQYLQQESIDIPDTEDTRSIRAAVIRRLKRRRREQERRDLAGAVFGYQTALSLAQVKAIASEMVSADIECRRFEKVIFKIDDISDDVIAMRHLPECKGLIQNGKCKSCGETTDGQAAFKLELVLEDVKDASVKLETGGGDALGNALFKKSASVVQAMSRSELDDVVETWVEVPILASMCLAYNTSMGKVSAYPFKLRRLTAAYV